MENKESHTTTLEFKCSSNPLVTLSNLSIQLCKFTETMQEFHTGKSDEQNEASVAVYRLAQLIFATFGACCTAKTPEILTNLARFCESQTDLILKDYFTRKEN